MHAPSYLGKRRRNHPKEMVSSRYLPDAPGIRAEAVDVPLPGTGLTSLGNSLDVMITSESAIVPFQPPEVEIIDVDQPGRPIIHRPVLDPSLPTYEENERAGPTYINPRRRVFKKYDTFSGAGLY